MNWIYQVRGKKVNATKIGSKPHTAGYKVPYDMGSAYFPKLFSYACSWPTNVPSAL